MDIGYDNHQENDGGNHWFFCSKMEGWNFWILWFFFVCLSNSSVSQKVLTTLFFQHLKGTFWRRGTFFLIGHRIILGLSELFNSMCHNRGMISNVRRSGSGKLFAKKEKRKDRMLFERWKNCVKKVKSKSKESRNEDRNPKKYQYESKEKFEKNLLRKKSKYFRQQKNVPT